MKNKLVFCFLLFLTTIVFTNYCFANGEIVGGATSNVINKTSNVVKDTVDGTKNIANDITSGIENSTESISNSVSNAAGDLVNSTRNISNSMDNSYNASSTNPMATSTFMGMDYATWWWIIIALIVILIVLLIWNYSNNITKEDD